MGSEALHNVLLQPVAASSLASVLSPLIPALHSVMFDLALDTGDDDVAFVSFSFEFSSRCVPRSIVLGLDNQIVVHFVLSPAVVVREFLFICDIGLVSWRDHPMVF